MFTGIIEEIGTIVKQTNEKITIEAKKILSDVSIGASIAVNGVCLTVTEYTSTAFSAQLSPETRKRTTLSNLYIHQKVNLERAMSINSRFGGHIVLGHVDGIGTVQKVVDQGDFSLWYFKVPENLTKYIVPKGSIAVDGISLTVVELLQDTFSVAIIPSTKLNTNLQFLSSGDKVNLETDIIGKYIEKLLTPYRSQSNISESFLKEHGFI
ncbi:MAG TPA: riboflavin synthase [Candidatus Hydrogenedens sp.]|nr:riboflavin synthase [Candidatus Hydrogenedens sp.]